MPSRSRRARIASPSPTRSESRVPTTRSQCSPAVLSFYSLIVLHPSEATGVATSQDDGPSDAPAPIADEASDQRRRRIEETVVDILRIRHGYARIRNTQTGEVIEADGHRSPQDPNSLGTKP